MQQHPLTPLASIAALILFIIAIARSPRKLHTALYILGAALICALIGAGIGIALGTAAGAGTLAGIAMQFGAIAASIERILRYRKSGPKFPVRP